MVALIMPLSTQAVYQYLLVPRRVTTTADTPAQCDLARATAFFRDGDSESKVNSCHI